MLSDYIDQNKKISIEDLINIIKSKCSKGISFCIYSDAEPELIEKDLLVYIDKYPDGDKDGNDVFSEFVTEEGLSLLYYGEQFEDVIENVLHQKPIASVEDFIAAINFYRDNDNFIDL